MLKSFLSGILVTALVGTFFGYARYFVGFFPVFHGALAAIIAASLFSGLKLHGGSTTTAKQSFTIAILWTILAYFPGQVFGLWLAHPWHDALGLIARIWDGSAGEQVMGATTTGHAFNLGIGGGFWTFLNLLDTAVLLILLHRLPWPDAVVPQTGEVGKGDVS